MKFGFKRFSVSNFGSAIERFFGFALDCSSVLLGRSTLDCPALHNILGDRMNVISKIQELITKRDTTFAGQVLVLINDAWGDALDELRVEGILSPADINQLEDRALELQALAMFEKAQSVTDLKKQALSLFEEGGFSLDKLGDVIKSFAALNKVDV